MKLRRNAPIEKIVPKPDDQMTLTAGAASVYFQKDLVDGRTGFLSATDGVAAMILRVPADPTDTEGAISREALESSRRLCPHEKDTHPMLELELGDALVSFDGEAGKVHMTRHPADRFPNLRFLIRDIPDGCGIAFNAKHLLRLAQAMGSEEVIIGRSPEMKHAIIVRPADPTVNDVELAVLMGLDIGDRAIRESEVSGE